MTIEEILTGEKDNIEYKVDIPSKSENYMRTVVAYANGNGGQLIFGVEDNIWQIVGFSKEEVFQKMDAITNAIYDSCEPKITPNVKLQEMNGTYIILVDIPAGMQRPYCIKSQGMIEGVYIRVSGTTRKAAIYQIQEMALSSRNRSYDSEPVERELSKAEVNQFCQRLYQHAQELCENEAAKSALKQIEISQLLSFKVIREESGKYFATNAYQLLDGELEDYPDAVIQCAVFKGTTRNIFITRKEFSGCIDEEVEAAYAFVLEHIDMGARIDGLVRQDIYELPIRTIREMITNAVCHRSYLSSGKVQVALFDDRLEVTSPGMLDKDLTVEKMKVGLSKVRNGAIAKIFSYMNMIEAWGTGIPRIFLEAKEYGLREPELVDMGNDFRINLYRRRPLFDRYGVIAPDQKSDHEIIREGNDTIYKSYDIIREGSDTIYKTYDTIREGNDTIRERNSTNEERLIALILDDATITQKAMKEKTGLSLSTVKRLISGLQKKGKIIRTGNNRSGKWQVKN